MQLTNGGVAVSDHGEGKSQVSFYAATMAGLAKYLSFEDFGHPILDHTSLTGHYDFVLNWVDDPDSKLPEGAIDSDDPDPLSHWNIDGLGLRVTPIKIPADTLVIDHIEKPSENWQTLVQL